MAYEITYGALVEGMMGSLRKQLVERNVIVVPGSKQEPAPIPQAPEPPMEQEPMLDGGTGNEDINAKINGPGFDAGVDADPDEDPKRYIQQLTGKLSTELQKYIDSGADQNGETSKYVLGMLVKQASKSLSEEDKKEIIKKINTTEQSQPSDTQTQGEETAETPEDSMPDDWQMSESLLTTPSTNPKDREDKKLRVVGTAAKKRNNPFISKF